MASDEERFRSRHIFCCISLRS